MKIKIFKANILTAAFAIALAFTSCNNDQNNPASIGEMNTSNDPVVTDTYSGPGATFIGMQMVANSSVDNYFWYGPKETAGNRQEFNESVFTDAQDFITATAVNGVPNYHGGNQRVGVWDQINAGMDGNLIDDNEVLIFTLGTDIPAGVKMVTASVNLSGGGMASIDLYDGVTLVGNVTTAGSGLVALNAGGLLFNSIRFSAVSGSYGINTGTYFYLASVNYIGVNTLNGTNNRYAYSSVIGNGVPNRQQFDNSNVNGNGNGAFLNASPNSQQWMTVSSSPGLTTFTLATFSWGVGADSRISTGESMSLKKGSSVVKDFIAAVVQYRNATAGAVATITIKKATVTLQTWNISLSTSGTLLIHDNQEFDEIVFESQTGTWNPVGNPAGTTIFYNTPL